MKLDTYQFERWPTILSGQVQADRQIATVETFAGVAIFDFGLKIAGKTITLRFNSCPVAQYAAIYALHAAGDLVVWDLEDGTGRTFSVKILPMTGDYHERMGSESFVVRKNVTVPLLIVEEL